MNAAHDVTSADSGVSERPDRQGSDTGERSIGVIVTDLWERTETLVRQEMKLGLTLAEEKVSELKVELYDKVDALKLELIAKAIGGVIVFAGLLTIVAGIVLLLAMAIKPWLAALLVGAALSLGGVLLLKREIKPAESAAQRALKHTQRELHAIEEASHDTAK
jgi:hypothetical protein